MSRKVLLILGIALFTGGLVLSFSKFTKAAQAPVLNGVSAISACGLSLNFNSPEDSSRLEIQTSKNPAFTSPNLIFNATDESGNQVSGSGDLNAITTSRLLRDMGYSGNVFYNQNTQYYFRVKVYPADGGAASGWSNSAGAITNELSVPGAPASLRVQGIGDGSKILIRWERGIVQPSFDDYGGFEIWRAASADGGRNYGNFTLVQRVPAERVDGSPFDSYEDNDNGSWLNPNYSYKYYLKAYQSDRGCRDDQIVVSGSSEEAVVPVRPSNLTANLDVDNKVDLAWRDNAFGAGNETTFEVWWSVGDNSNYVLKYSRPADSESFKDNDVQQGRRYFYKIRGCQGGNQCSAYSNEADVATGAASANDLTGRIYFTDSVGLNTNVYLAWDAVIGNTYTVLRKEIGTGTEMPVSGCSGTADSGCRDLNMPLGKKYEYRLKIEKGGVIAYSNIVPLNLDIRLVLKGLGWSSAGEAGMGWIKFRSDEAVATKYSVQIDNEGLLSGAAWASKNYGWLSFNKGDLEGCPSAPCEAKFNSSANFLSGWGRFLVSKFFPGQSSFEGWVKLKGNDYGVEFTSSTRQFSGLGWGGDVAGWTAFGAPCAKCNLSADILGEVPPAENHMPFVEDVLIEVGPVDDGLWCADAPFYRVKWNYRDPEESPQTKAEIEFIPRDFATTSEGSDISFRLYDPLAHLAPLTNYIVRVRASDGEKWSDWVASNSTTTLSHYPPLVNFEWSPTSSIAVGQPVNFRDKSNDRSGGVYPPSGWDWRWQFNNGVPSEATGTEAIARFSVLPSDASLTVLDSGSLSCGLTERIGGAGGPPRRRIFRER